MRIYERKARKTRFLNGHRTPAENKQGYTTNYYEPRDDNDPVICRAGDMYFTWHPKGQPWQFSKTRPVILKRLNEHEETMTGFEDRKEDLQEQEEADELLDEVRSYRDDLDTRLNNMPEQLQESSILNERLEALDELITELENWS